MNQRKMKLAKRRSAVMIITRIRFWRKLPIPMGWIRAIAWWIGASVVAIALFADWSAEICGRFVEFFFAMFALCLLTPMLAFEFLCNYHCALNVAILAYVYHALLIVSLAKTSCRMMQILAMSILAVQSVCGIYGLFHGIPW